jgi:NADPH2:quinone reductase
VSGFWFRHCLERPQERLAAPVADLFARAVAGDLRIVVGGVYPLAEAARAQVDLAERRTTGKLLIDVRA